MLKRAYECLKDGASFAMDFHNFYFLMKQPSQRRDVKKNAEGKDIIIERFFHFNLEEGSNSSEWRYTFPDGTKKTKQGTTKIYLPHQLKAMLLEVGFKSVECYGDLFFGPLTADCPSCYLVAKK